MFTLTNGGFKYPDGTPVANGRITFELSQSARIIAGGQVAPQSVTYSLDANGNVVSGATLYANAELSPDGTWYRVTVFDANGARVWGPIVTVLATNDLNGLTPAILEPVASSGSATVDWSGISNKPLVFPPDATAELKTNKGAANGYAALDGTGKLPASQLPTITFPVTSVAGKVGAVSLVESDIANLPTDIAATEKTANRGVANGYASLDGTGKVPSGQLPPSSLVGNSAIKPSSVDYIQYVSPSGNDTNDGLSWGSAKATVASALTNIGANKGIVMVSPAMSSDGVAGTGNSTGLNGTLLSSKRLYLGPQAQATATQNQPSQELRIVGSIWNGTKACDDFWTIQNTVGSDAMTAGSDLQINHSSISGGAGRLHINSDMIIGPPASATSAPTHYNSFAWDNEGSYWDGDSVEFNLWEIAVTTTANAGGGVNSRQNILPIFTGSTTGCTAEVAFGASGTLGAQGNYPGAPMWVWRCLPRDGYTATFTHTFTADRNFTYPDASGTIALLDSPAFTGIPTAPTPATADNSTALATTAWVKAQGYGTGSGGGAWGSIAGTLSAQTDLQSALDAKAPLASPTFTGVITAPSVSATGATVSGTLTIGSTPLIQESSGILAQKSGTTNQLHRIYQTTDGTNSSWLDVGYITGDGRFAVQTMTAGSATQADLYFSGQNVRWGAGGSTRLILNSSGHLVFNGDNTYDIGTTASGRPRSVYVGSRVVGGKSTPTISSGALNLDASLGNTFRVSLTANVTSMSIANGADGQVINILWVQDATGSRTVTMASNLKGATSPSSGANTRSAQSFVYDSTTSNWYALGTGSTGM